MTTHTAGTSKGQSAAKATKQAASSSAVGSTVEDPKSGYDDVIVPDESADTATTASEGPSRDKPAGAVPGRAGQDDAEPEATMPGGTAKAGGEEGSGIEAQAHGSGAKQKQLDASPSAGRKRNAAGKSHASPAGPSPEQPSRMLPKRQCKLNFTPK